MSRLLAQELRLRCLDLRDGPAEVVAGFAYDPGDPYAVWVTVSVPDGVLRWAVCRALLCRGLTDPVGMGDVRVRPGTDRTGGAVVVLELRSPQGRIAGEVPTRELHRFLTRTLAAVPLGCEQQHLDVDSLIGALLSGPE